MKLVLAENPSVAQSIAKVLIVSHRDDGSQLKFLLDGGKRS